MAGSKSSGTRPRSRLLGRCKPQANPHTAAVAPILLPETQPWLLRDPIPTGQLHRCRPGPAAGGSSTPKARRDKPRGCCLQPRLHYSPASRANKASAPRAGKLGKVYKSEALTTDCTEKSYKGCIQPFVATKLQKTVLTAAHPAQLATLPISTGIKRSDSRKKIA